MIANFSCLYKPGAMNFHICIKINGQVTKKAGSWIGTAKKYMHDIQNEVSNIDIDDEKTNEIKKDNKKDE